MKSFFLFCFVFFKEEVARIHRTKQKRSHNQDHNGMITHLEPDILECKIKWALGNVTIKKLVEVMEF